MNRAIHATAQALLLLAIAWGPAALADDFEIEWYTVDGGGVMWSTGGGFELGGTIGQADASAVAMSEGSFGLVGGFWTVPPCWCISDVNNDGYRDGRDVQGFIDCILAGGTNCACADLYTDGVLDGNDITAFIGNLLAGESCP
jgi:hypothetical protein